LVSLKRNETYRGTYDKIQEAMLHTNLKGEINGKMVMILKFRLQEHLQKINLLY